jgi:magnesium-transporting ATPase (P-type)
MTTPIYCLRASEALQALDTSAYGLSEAEALTRLALYGQNTISREKKQPAWEKFLGEFIHPSILVLLVVGLAVFLQGDPILAAIIWTIALVSAGFSTWREYRAEQAIEKLREILPSVARVVRAGNECSIPSIEIVPGDILILAEGSNIPADGRVIEEYGLRTNNATLTGEAMPARRTSDPSQMTGLSELEQPNLIFAGTTVASGTGRAIVIRTGMATQFGRIAHLTQTIPEEPTPFQRELNRLGKFTAWIGVVTGAVVFSVGYFTLEFPLRMSILLALGIIVAVIPEGLIATLTLSLAVAAQRLAQAGVLVKKLSTVEKLGQVSVVCTDKSGTLTQNQMTVREIWVARQRLKVLGAGYAPQGGFQPAPDGKPWEADLRSLLEVGSACNNARVLPPSAGSPLWTCLGDPTEAAMKVAAMKGGVQEETMNRSLPRIHELPFDARRKRMTTIHRSREGGIAFVKGAPREVLQLCNRIWIEGEQRHLSDELRAEILAANDEYARGALRVLALARRSLPPRSGAYLPETVEKDLTFMGLMAMMDPPRPEVEKAVQVCSKAGIRIVMITGDYGLTAESLARRVGLLTTRHPAILTGAELDELSEAQLLTLLDNEIIFSRMAPEHKVRLVSTFQSRGDVVAVTGDGVNDAPALRKADIGIAMGIIGTDVAKEAADVILTRDDFGAIATAIEEGRGVYDNIRKFITYMFSSNIPEIAPFVMTASLPWMPLALSVRQILAIDLGTDLFPSLGLGMERPETDVMSLPPRPRTKPLLDSGLMWRAFWLGSIETVLCFAGYLAVFLLSGHAAEVIPGFPAAWVERVQIHLPLSFSQAAILAGTAYHAGVVASQVGNALACRSDRLHRFRPERLGNKYLLAGIFMEAAGIAGMVYIPALARIFNHAPLPLWMFLGLGAYAIMIYSLEWMRKAVLHGIQGLRHRRSSTHSLQEVR